MSLRGMTGVAIDRWTKSFGQDGTTRRHGSSPTAGREDGNSIDGGCRGTARQRGKRKTHRKKAVVVTS
jgi:hypothetical protein